MKDVKERKRNVVKPHSEYIFESIRTAATSKPVFEVAECQLKKGTVSEEEFSKLELMLEGLVMENILSKVDGGYTFHSNVERAYFLNA